AGKAPGPGVGQRDHADVDIALLEDAVVGQEVLKIVTDLEARIAERGDVVEQLRRQLPVHPADAEIRGMQAAAGGTLIESHELFALFKAPERRGERADVHGLRRHVEQVREEPSDLAIEHAYELRSPGHCEAEELLRREAEGMLLVHRRHVVEAVEIRNRLQIGLVLDQLLGGAMQEPDMRVDALHHLAVKFEDQAQYAVAAGCCGPKLMVKLRSSVSAMASLSFPVGRLLVPRQRIVRAFPWREEIEVSEFLRQP